MAKFAQAVSNELLDPKPRVMDFVLVREGLFAGCSGLVEEIEPGLTGLPIVNV